VVNWSAAHSSVLSAAFSSASFGSALSVVGLPNTIPLGGVGGCFALIYSGLIIGSKKHRGSDHYISSKNKCAVIYLCS